MSAEHIYPLIIAVVLIAGLVVYRAGYAAGERAALQRSLLLPQTEIETLHWLAENGFSKLLWAGMKGRSGFKNELTARAAHNALDSLEAYLPTDQPENRWDKSFDRMGLISIRFKTDPLTPAEQMLVDSIFDAT